jgi:glycosyltransferase involved in cell wall biosynthesis
MPKIALVSPYTLPFCCGNSLLVERLSNGLSSKGFSVAVYNAKQNNPEEAVACAPDILHTLNADKSYKWAEQFLAKHTVPWVITFTGTDYNTWCGVTEPPLHVKKSLEKASVLIVFHEQASRFLSRAVPHIAGKVQVIPQGVSSSERRDDCQLVRSQLGITHDEVVFLMVAGIRPVKNLGFAIEAFADVEKQVPSVKLLLLGPVIDEEEADKIFNKGRKIKCFRYLGVRTPHEVRTLMGAGDVLLNTSLHEGMPGAVLEAMAEGVPILASAVPGNTVLVQDGVNGLLFNPEDRGELANAVMQLAGDSSLRKSLGQTGKNIAETNYSISRELNNYYSLYTSLLER